MSTITARQLHLETKTILDQLEKGEPVIITRNGLPIARLEPLAPSGLPAWDEVMREVWLAQKRVKVSERTRNPVLAERQRRRR